MDSKNQHGCNTNKSCGWKISTIEILEKNLKFIFENSLGQVISFQQSASTEVFRKIHSDGNYSYTLEYNPSTLSIVDFY